MMAVFFYRIINQELWEIPMDWTGYRKSNKNISNKKRLHNV